MALLLAAAALSAVAFVVAFPSNFSEAGLWWSAPAIVAGLAAAAVAAPSARALVFAVGIAWAAAWWWHQAWIGEVSALGLPAFVAYLTLNAILLALALRALARAAWLSHVPFALWIPPLWIGFEFLRAEILFDGYPWYLVAHPFAEVPILIQSADLSGAPAVGWVVAMLGGALLDLGALAMRSLRRGAPDGTRRRALIGAACAALGLLGSVAYGAWRLGEADALRAGPTILAIQTNVPQSNKMSWSAESQIEALIRFREVTADAFESALDGPQPTIPDLVAWPETMLPGFGLEPESIAAAIAEPRSIGDLFARAILSLAEWLSRPMLVGSSAYLGLRFGGPGDVTWDRHYNAAYLVNPDGTLQRSDKRVLTPFGETMPYISAWPWLEQRLLDLGARGMTFDLDRAETIRTLTVPAHRAGFDEEWRVGAPICFEATVAWFCRKLAWEGGSRRVEVFVNISNDGWFGDNVPGRRQHAQIARFRCVENRTPMVRSVNTGITVAFDSSGRAIPPGPVPAMEEAALLVELSLDGRTPPFARLGEVLGYGCVVLTGAALAATICVRRGRRSPPSAGRSRATPRNLEQRAERGEGR
ncbi:MAG TPA: apolipoprotein N-acyltransferase [Phycisphaerales bacterium]|nr:apolipoprotein N-acyltransferase [Phycisphaerales bacterium]HMP37757.1 apolipoprotein N-acyltransferase [Phycisphaerales bacterium]